METTEERITELKHRPIKSIKNEQGDNRSKKINKVSGHAGY